MEEKLKQARFALMTMFEVLENDIVEMKSRKQNKQINATFQCFDIYALYNYRFMLRDASNINLLIFSINILYIKLLVFVALMLMFPSHQLDEILLKLCWELRDHSGVS